MNIFKKLFSRKKIDIFPEQLNTEGYLPSTADTLTAIKQLSEAVKDNPDSIELYLALGNLIRAQSEFERAILIRQSIIARPNISPVLKARAWYELGIDYKRAGLIDRAVQALQEARKIAGDNSNILEALAKIYAQSHDFKQAVYYYHKLNHYKAEAHYLVKWSQTLDLPQKIKLIKKALNIYPKSPEAWLELLLTNWQTNNPKEFKNNFHTAIYSAPKHKDFIILEGLYEALKHKTDEPQALQDFILIMEEVLANKPTVLNNYYNALFLILIKEQEQARTWLEKSLILNNNFWPARLILLQLDVPTQQLSDNFKAHLEFFIQHFLQAKFFICEQCGLKRKSLFFLCPRCSAWHSIAFYTSLHE
ncbi:MAG: hypothetical protein Q9M37_08035 [Desulfonauticus sp.]|nr:hypothetical protein [Desulfonauticus sp.]